MKEFGILKRVWLLLIFLAVGTYANTNMWISAGQSYGIEPRLLYAISKVESNVRPLLVSVSYLKLSKMQRDKLYQMLKNKRIPYSTLTKVIEIYNKNAPQAKQVINFLDYNHYKSFDIGLMQINNLHKKRLLKHKIALPDLLNEDTNLNIAASILFECYKKYRSTDKAINAYNGRLKGNPYYTKVTQELRKLLLPSEGTSKRLFYAVL